MAAFVAVVPPLATLVIALLPALIPAFVTLTVFVVSAFVIVSPVVSSLLLPAVTLSTVRFLFNSISIFPDVPLVVIFPSAPITSTASPKFF